MQSANVDSSTDLLALSRPYMKADFMRGPDGTMDSDEADRVQRPIPEPSSKTPADAGCCNLTDGWYPRTTTYGREGRRNEI